MSCKEKNIHYRNFLIAFLKIQLKIKLKKIIRENIFKRKIEIKPNEKHIKCDRLCLDKCIFVFILLLIKFQKNINSNDKIAREIITSFIYNH